MKKSENRLFPVFLKLEQLHTLVVGGGYVGIEKLEALLGNAPKARITVVAPEIRPEIEAMTNTFSGLNLIYEPFKELHLEDKDLVVVGTGLEEVSSTVKKSASERKILCNVADNPPLCDFYLGSIVKKGNIKIAISTNGKSPTVAKRLRELLTEVLPEKDINEVMEQMNVIRLRLKNDFEYKVKKLNQVTAVFSGKASVVATLFKYKWGTIVLLVILSIGFLIGLFASFFLQY